MPLHAIIACHAQGQAGVWCSFCPCVALSVSHLLRRPLATSTPRSQEAMSYVTADDTDSLKVLMNHLCYSGAAVAVCCCLLADAFRLHCSDDRCRLSRTYPARCGAHTQRRMTHHWQMDMARDEAGKERMTWQRATEILQTCLCPFAKSAPSCS